LRPDPFYIKHLDRYYIILYNIIKGRAQDGTKRINEVAGKRRLGNSKNTRLTKHPTKPGTISVALHNKDMAPGTLNKILKAAGLK
jgi:hypothetical protein